MFNSDEIQQFERDGYLVIRNLLEGELLYRIREAFDELDGYHNLLDRDMTFLEVAAMPSLLNPIKSLLCPHPHLLQFDGVNRVPGSGDQRWHSDFKFRCDKPLMLNVGIYLDELTMDNGPIWVTPGSHRDSDPPPNPDVDGIALTLPEGSAVIFDCTLAHKGGGNRSNNPRRAVFPTYGHYWMKRFETWMPYATLERFPDASSEMQQLLGIQLHASSDYSGYDETRIMRKNLDGEWE